MTEKKKTIEVDKNMMDMDMLMDPEIEPGVEDSVFIKTPDDENLTIVQFKATITKIYRELQANDRKALQ